ncbi:hypothetical protein HDU98_005855 [Podochytrium sp. JEL0797]|nr:hypothetical protein HDU98_005855 [Podochytrium sp. JEL0797]
MYMMLMQRQYEMMMALASNATPSNVAVFGQSLSGMGSPIGSNFGAVSGNGSNTPVGAGTAVSVQRNDSGGGGGSTSQSGNVSTSTNTSCTQPPTMCTIGTNTSLIFDASVRATLCVVSECGSWINPQNMQMFSKKQPVPTAPHLPSPNRDPVNTSTTSLLQTTSPTPHPESPPPHPPHSTPASLNNISTITTPAKPSPHRLISDISPPLDTGTNYKPLYTFETIPMQSFLDQTSMNPGRVEQQHPVRRGGGGDWNRGGGSESGGGRRKPPVYPGGGGGGGGNGVGERVDTTTTAGDGKAGMTTSPPRLSKRETSGCNVSQHQHVYDAPARVSGVGGMVGTTSRERVRPAAAGSIVDSQMMLSLDLSGIENNELIGEDATFEEAVVSEVEDERTRELIAQLVENAEQSFIFRDVEDEEEVGGERRGGKEEVVGRIGLRSGNEGRDSFVEKGGRGGFDDVSVTREQFSKATLEYLTKYGLN